MAAIGILVVLFDSFRDTHCGVSVINSIKRRFGGMDFNVAAELVKRKPGEVKDSSFYQAVLKGDDEIIMRLKPGESFSAIGVSVGETQQIWTSSVRGSVSTIRYHGQSVELVCKMAMYVTDIWPVGDGRLLLAGSTSDRYLVELVDQAAFSARVAVFERLIGGGNLDTGQAAYPTFGIDVQRLFVGWRLRKKGGTRVGANALSIPALVPFFQPIEPFDLVPALIGAGIDTQRLLEAVDEQNFYRQLYI